MRKFGTYGIAAVLALGVMGPISADDKTDYETILKKVQTDAASVSDQEVIQLMKLSRKLGESFDATLAMKSYLRQQTSPEVMLEIARTTALSGDLNLAVARYKRYLSSARPDAASSGAAAELYTILIEDLKAHGDAYLLMQDTVTKFRASSSARRFDQWFMSRALREKDYVSLARMLEAALNQDADSQLARTYYWPVLGSMMDRVAGLGADQVAVLPAVQRTMRSFKGQGVLKARYDLNLAAFDYRVKSKSMDEAGKKRAYKTVLDAARNYLKQDQSEAALRHVMIVFSGGSGLYRNNMAEFELDKAKVILTGYNAMSEKDRYQFRKWGYSQNLGRLIMPPVWAMAGAKDQVFYSGSRSDEWRKGFRDYSFNDLRQQAKAVEGMNTTYAATIRSILASGGKDFSKAADHMYKNESWYLASGAAWGALEAVVFPYIARQRGKNGKDDWNGRNEATIAYGKQLSKSPAIVWEQHFLRRYLEALSSDFNNLEANLKLIQWLPADKRQKDYNNALRNLDRWVKGQRKREGAASKIASITEVMKKMGSGSAPNQAAAETLNLMKALRAKDVAAFKSSIDGIAKAYGDYNNKKTPYGHAVISSLLRDRGNQYVPAQAALLADQVNAYSGKGEDYRLYNLMDAMTQQTRYRQYFRGGRNEKNVMVPIYQAIAPAMAKAVANGELPIGLMHRWRGTRMGDRWRMDSQGNEIFKQIIDKKLLEKTGWRHQSNQVLATPSYQTLIHNEFPQLVKTNNPENWFDQRFIEEAKAEKFWDRAYWERGRDTKREITKAAAVDLGAQQTIPLKRAGQGQYTSDDLGHWYWRIRSNDAKAANEMFSQLASYYGKTRFDLDATGRYGTLVEKIDLNKAGPRNEWFKALEEFVTRAESLPIRMNTFDMQSFRDFRGDLSSSEARTLERLMMVMNINYDGRGTYPNIARKLSEYLVKQKEWSRLSKLMPTMWLVARESRNSDLQDFLAQQAVIFQRDEQADLAIQIAVLGLDMLKSELSESSRTVLSAARGKAMANVEGVIPVPQGDPRYPLYAAQNAYLTGKVEGAWKFYENNQSLLETMYAELDPSFVIWLIERHAGRGEQELVFAESMADQLTLAADKAAGTMDPETRARIYMTPAKLSMRSSTSRARALYQRVAENPDFAGTEARIDALLAMADIDRIDKNYDSAEKILEMLSKRADRRTRALVAYADARMKFDQEEYPKAKELVDMSMSLFATSDAAILSGEIAKAMKDYEAVIEATPPGSINEKLRVIVPGKALVIRLEDKNLSVIGSSTSIEIKAWTDSGDEEIFNLTPLGDRRDTFKGQRTTALGAPQKNDGIIQLRGNDKLYYSYSDRFVRENNIANQEVLHLEVKSNAEMYASSGSIMTQEERERRAEEERIIRAEGLQVRRDENRSALSTRRPDNQIKPGNPINIRVIDSDRSTSEAKDVISVRVSVPSGDEVANLELTETEPFSGVFEGQLKTSSGQPKAYASDSQDGSEPNHVISPDEHEAWVALPNSVRPKMFSVDLNDNIALNRLVIDANVEGRKLKDFYLQTSLNGRDFKTLSRWPKPFKGWDGRVQLEAAPISGGFRPATDNAYAQYMEHGFLSESAEKYVVNPSEAQMKFKLNSAADKARGVTKAGYDEPMIFRYRMAFNQVEPGNRTFQLKRTGRNTRTNMRGVTYVLHVNGVPAPRSRDSAANVIQRRLKQGVHVVEVFVIATGRQVRDADLGVELLVDTPAPPYQELAPKSMFGGPIVAQELALPKVDIKSSGAGEFTVNFPAEVNARVVRLVIQDYESDAPGLNSIKLTDQGGKQILPTKESFEKLRQNDILEIVPGDRVTILYQDPSYLSEAKDQLEAYLTATYTNATISAAFVEYNESGGRNRASYIPMRRFKVGDTLNVFIRDPDMDVSAGQDTVTFTARTNVGNAVTLEAIETEAHSGIFIGKVFPVDGAAQRKEDLKTAKGNRIILTYRDQDNLDPGIGWDRTAEVEQVQWEQPLVRIFDTSSQDIANRSTDVTEEDPAALGRFEEFYPKYKDLVMLWPEDSAREKAEIVLGGPMVVEVLNPAIAKSSQSRQRIFVQTSTGLEMAKESFQPESFNKDIPGTIELTATPGDAGGAGTWLKSYANVITRSQANSGAALDDGRFSFAVPYEMGVIEDALLTEDEKANPKLKVNAGDTVYVGVPYTTASGEERWITKSITFKGDTFMEVMDRRHQEILTDRYVGEDAYIRVLAPMMNTSDEKDKLAVNIQTSSGQNMDLELFETFSHSGEFKGLINISHVDEMPESEVERPKGTLFVKYGDKITFTYGTESDQLIREVEINKGFDGSVTAFTKRFKDDKIAIRTQFALVEAYFELAKKHRELAKKAEAKGDEKAENELSSLARREIQIGRKLLVEAMRDFPDNEFKAEAEFLLANLDMELGDETDEKENTKLKKELYNSAINRFTDIVGKYPNHAKAPEAQYKKALAYERLAKFEPSYSSKALEEFVKLSYRYPDSERVADTIVRLGNYFRSEGEKLTAKADELKDTDQVESIRLQKQAQRLYQTAAEVFSRLNERYPEHKLALTTQVLSGYYYVAAGKYQDALERLYDVMNKESATAQNRADAMYWAAFCYQEMEKSGKFKEAFKSPSGQLQPVLQHAYIMLKKITWDFPDTNRARQARTILTQEEYAGFQE